MGIELNLNDYNRFAADPVRMERAVASLQSRVSRTPELAIVLGSGLSYLADRLTQTTIIRSDEIDGYPQPTVEGHFGRLVFGVLEGYPVLAVQGRSHYYEGVAIPELTFAVQLYHALGIRYLILTNAAGSTRADIRPGSVVFLNDYINFPQMEIVPAQTQLTPFSERLANLAYLISRDHPLETHKGVYCWTTGPSYETPAEVDFIRSLGGSVVGMSTVPEALVSAYLGMELLGVSLVTNLGAGISETPLNHAEVQEAAEKVKEPYSALLSNIIRRILELDRIRSSVSGT